MRSFFIRGAKCDVARFGCTDVNLTTSRNLATPPLSGRGLFVVFVEVSLSITIWLKIEAVCRRLPTFFEDSILFSLVDAQNRLLP